VPPTTPATALRDDRLISRFACCSTLPAEDEVVTLTLEITESTEATPRDSARHRFGEEGGSIGRAATNSWVLSHSKVSGQHAQITFRNGVFYIQDTSRNGVSVNSPENRLARSRPYALKAGDRILIEPYAIDVWIDAGERAAREPHADPFASDDPFAPRYDPSPSRRNPEPLQPAPISDEVDPLIYFEPVGGRTARKPDPVVVPSDDLLNAHYEPPAIVPGPEPPAREPDSPAIPQGYDPLKPDEPFVEPPPTPTPVRPRPGRMSEPRRKARDSSPGDSTIRQPASTPPVPSSPAVPEPVLAAPVAPPPVALPPVTPLPVAPPPVAPSAGPPTPRQAGAHADLAELLAGAGVPDAAITPELSRNLGQILRIVVSGLMDVLQSRQRIKEEFGMQQTMFRQADNNPLKFSANLEDALHNLLVKRNAAYLNPVDAFADAFDDLRDHQLAMLAGMRVAFDAMLAEFDAEKLQAAFDAQAGKHSLPLLPAKLRYWDLYRERGEALMKDPEAAFARLFGDEFSSAYEEQFRKLKATRRTRADRPADQDPPAKPE
jgi:type VI secretion system FHA domain protein